ncbi:MAG: YraN family protein [Prevotella sp.]|nr:YraN family protein [Prevotella sp.]
MAYHNDLGKWGEDVAVSYLEQKGYAILHRDWSYRHRDLDIVAVDNGVLVIIEVKTRRDERFADADEAVTPQKIRSVSIAANAYVKQYGISLDIRFDIITIVGHPGGGHELRHVKDAFLPFV